MTNTMVFELGEEAGVFKKVSTRIEIPYRMFQKSVCKVNQYRMV